MNTEKFQLNLLNQFNFCNENISKMNIFILFFKLTQVS